MSEVKITLCMIVGIVLVIAVVGWMGMGYEAVGG